MNVVHPFFQERIDISRQFVHQHGFIEKPVFKFIKSIEQALSNKNYVAALSLALTLPEICISLTTENGKTGRSKYAKWFEEFVSPCYEYSKGSFSLNGKECYALRCSVLHNGTHDVSTAEILKDIANAAKKFCFCTEEFGTFRMRVNDTVLLNVEDFCTNLCNGVYLWYVANATNEVVDNAMNNILQIHTEGFSPHPMLYIGN